MRPDGGGARDREVARSGGSGSTMGRAGGRAGPRAGRVAVAREGRAGTARARDLCHMPPGPCRLVPLDEGELAYARPAWWVKPAGLQQRPVATSQATNEAVPRAQPGGLRAGPAIPRAAGNRHRGTRRRVQTQPQQVPAGALALDTATQRQAKPARPGQAARQAPHALTTPTSRRVQASTTSPSLWLLIIARVARFPEKTARTAGARGGKIATAVISVARVAVVLSGGRAGLEALVREWNENSGPTRQAAGMRRKVQGRGHV